MTPTEIAEHPIFNGKWYHKLELAPGLVTKGAGFDNLVVTRSLLDGVNVAGQNCLDIGAMDGLNAYLLERRGAARPVAYDRNCRPSSAISNGDRFRFAREALGSKVEYLWDMPLKDVWSASAAIGLRTYDVVVFAGVLYHMFDPLSGLAVVRNLVRNGGILIVETGATLDASASMHANVAGRFYPADDYWLPSVRTLEYWMRFLHLEPLDGAFLHHRVVDGLPVIRVAVACRAVESFRATPEDTRMHRQDEGLFNADFQECLNWEEVKSDRPPVPYTHSGGHIAYHPGTNVIDLFTTLTSNPALQAAAHPELSQLMLADR
jgi:SAM-dependent methyltransferase